MKERRHIEPTFGDIDITALERQAGQTRAPWEEDGFEDEHEHEVIDAADEYPAEAFDAEEQDDLMAAAGDDAYPIDPVDQWVEEFGADASPSDAFADDTESDEELAPWEEPVPVVAAAPIVTRPVSAKAAAPNHIDTDTLLAARVVSAAPVVVSKTPAIPESAALVREPEPAGMTLPAALEPRFAHESAPAPKKDEKRLHSVVWYDRQLLVAAFSLLAIGLIMVTSSSLAIAEKETGNSFYYALRHGFYMALAIAGAIVVLQVPMNFWMRSGTTLLLSGIALLLLILVPGVGHEVNGSVRWIRMGGFTLQVSELVKLFLVIFMAGYLVRKSDEVRTQIKGFLKPLALLGVLGILLLMEPDFGATVVVFTTVFAMMFLAGAQLWQYIAIGGAGLGGLWVIATASPYRMKRLTTFLDPWSDPYGSGYQLTQSLIAFGRGGLTGQGLGNSVQKLAYLPEAHTDFVFAVLAEELGLVGVVAVLAIFAWLAYRIFQVGRSALNANQPFSAYIAFGIAVWLSLQAVVNIGVSSGILPTKGLTLPLVSYGGSSLIVTTAAVAIVLRIDFERRLREHFGLGRTAA